MVTYNDSGRGTKKSHFVWRKYLESFSSTDTMIFQYNFDKKTTKEIKIIHAGKKNDIYRLNEKISTNDVYFFKKMYGSCCIFDHDGDRVLNEIVCFLNNDFSCCIPLSNMIINELNSDVYKKLNKVMLSRNQEELFTYYENSFLAIHRSLLKKNSAFFNGLYDDKKNMILGYNAGRTMCLSNFLKTKFCDLMCELGKDRFEKQYLEEVRKSIRDAIEHQRTEMEKYKFCHEDFLASNFFLTFLLTQMFRTKKMYDKIIGLKNRVLSIEGYNKGKEVFASINFQSYYALFIHAKLFKMGAALIEKEYRIVFIENDTKLNFITSDQPVINTFIENNEEKKLGDEEFELYYPLTPKLSMLFTLNKQYIKKESLQAKEKDVKHYNKLLAGNALNFIYSCTESDLAMVI